MTAISFNTAPMPVQQDGQKTIHTGDFWPVIDLDHMRRAGRIDNSVTSERLYHAAVNAAVYVNAELDGLMRQAAAAGYAALSQTDTTRVVNGETLPEIHYRRAVYAYTAAELLETYADAAATGKTADRAEAKQQQAEDRRRDGHYAVAALLHRRRIDSELI